MKQILLQIINIILAALCLLGASNSYADYGSSCISVGVWGSANNHVATNAVSYLREHIDMTSRTPNGCNQPDNQIQFCLRGNGGDCDLVTLNHGDSVRIANVNSNPDVGGNPVIGDIVLTTEVYHTSILCVSMSSVIGLTPIVCRETGVAIEALEENAPEDCRPIGRACYNQTSNSQSLLNFSGVTVQCLTESLDQLFFDGNECEVSGGETALYTALRPFPEFQSALTNAVRAVLILYVMVYGFKLVMDVRNAELNQVAAFVIKFLLVAYFSVGLGPRFYNADVGQIQNRNGVTEWVLPALVGATSSFAEFVFRSAGARGLCYFDPDKYNVGYEYYGLWDSIDCRLAFYLGMQAMYNIGSAVRDLAGTIEDLGSGSNSEADFGEKSDNAIDVVDDVFSFAIFPVMFGFLLAGNIIVVICSLIMSVMLISVVFYFLTTYIVCTVTLYVLAYVSPIFVPMALFERTKNYFVAWRNVTFSVVLQPAVIAGFIALLLTFYDTAIFGNCEYRRHDYSFEEYNFSTFEVRVPDFDAEKCTESPGYKLTRYYIGNGWEERILILFAVPILQDVWDLTVSMVYVMIFILIFYFILKYVSEFASDLTSGPNLESATVSATFVADKIMKGAAKLAQAKAGMDQNAKLPSFGGEEKERKSDMGRATDQATGGDIKDAASSGQSAASGGGQDLSDKVSTKDEKG